ncbi:hypothetical protein [Cohnella sp. GbtcB17]|uniref:hypothetical protein n=1 Tax=Cohnella sp. GbtcB17 TaxID=2824762 RepID=UPI001C2F760D|nr:hypothetical protein [Cohnella sp. GbtcB17]
MNVQLEFSGFIITELIYRIATDIPEGFHPRDEEVEQKAQGKLAIHKELEVCIFEYEIDLKTFINSEVFRTLELSVNFQFNLNFENKEDILSERDMIIGEIRNKFSGDILSFIKFEVKEIIRKLTSVDHFSSISNGEDILFVVES